MTEDLEKFLDKRLPLYHDKWEPGESMERISEDITSLRRTISEYANDYYSKNNSPGPIEVSIDTESFDEAMDKVSETFAHSQRMLTNHLGGVIDSFGDTIEELSEAIGENNELLDSIYSEQRQTTRGIGKLRKINEENLAINVLGLGVAFRSLCEMEEINTELYYANQTLEGIDYELQGVNQNLELVAENQERQIALQGEIIDWLKRTNSKIQNLEVTVVDCFTALGEQQEIISKEVVNIHQTLRELVQGQDRMRQEIVGTLKHLAGNSFSIRADERYSFAYEHYQLGKYSAAIKEINAALREKSIHIPSLILLGAISAHYALWSKAKDSYYYAAKLAERSGEIKLYHTAMIGLANIEYLVGNTHKAKRIIDEAVSKNYSSDVDLAYLKMRARRMK